MGSDNFFGYWLYVVDNINWVLVLISITDDTLQIILDNAIITPTMRTLSALSTVYFTEFSHPHCWHLFPALPILNRPNPIGT